jgi:hypothetical protein
MMMIIDNTRYHCHESIISFHLFSACMHRLPVALVIRKDTMIYSVLQESAINEETVILNAGKKFVKDR